MSYKNEFSHPQIGRILNSSVVLALVLDLNGCIVDCNKKCEEITGHSLGQLRGKLMHELFPMQEASFCGCPGNNLRDSFPPRYDTYCVGTNADLRFIAWAGMPVLSNDSVQQLLCIGIDITDRKRMEADLRNSLAVEEVIGRVSRLLLSPERPDLNDIVRIIAESFALKNASVMRFEQDDQKSARAWNYPHTETSHDLSEAGLLHFSWWINKLEQGEYVFLPDHAASSEEMLKGKGCHAVVFPISSLTQGLVGCMRLGGLETMRKWTKQDLAAFRDIADMIGFYWERDKAQKELLRNMELTQLASHAKSEFLASISHEIRTPMNAILGLSELALDAELTCDQRREYLETIKSSADSLLRILDAYLMYRE